MRSLALALLVLAPLAAAGGGATVTTTYVGGNGLAIACLLPQPAQVDFAGGCFIGGLAGFARATLDVRDVTSLPVGGRYDFLDHDGTVLARDEFCGGAAADVPEGSTALLVFLGGVYASACGPGLLDGEAVAGTITAAFA